jgi:hypothetical protein
MTPAARAALMAAAKPKAWAVANCVAAASARGIAKHLDGMDHETQALVLVLAASVDHALLAAVCAETDDGMPVVAERPETPQRRSERLREARSEARRLKNAGLPVPDEVAVLARECDRVRKQAQRRQEAA